MEDIYTHRPKHVNLYDRISTFPSLEITPAKNTIFGTIEGKWEKQWKIKFDFKVNAHIATYVNILDFGPAPSGRDPAFWINPSRQLNPAFNINGANFGFNVPVTINEGQYYSVEIAQFLVFKKVVK